ncbi:unnamed protein product [Adineta ricciae]|uniref:Uncharacterized protein n=1 Tax=Adineta ricciae TaxID=249248 RepID=A0A816BL21_ADIRI|nr:unnamed protein product [Adineta ricciae]
MELEKLPTLPHAHQQIRLGDVQASAQKWIAAIEHYSRAIEYFKAIQNTLRDDSLIATIQAQIVQCEKTIHFYRLKDPVEQAFKEEQQSKVTRAHSISNSKPSSRPARMMTRHNTLQLENTVMLGGRGDMDSFAALIFPNSNRNNPHVAYNASSPLIRRKNEKNHLQKMEELEMNYKLKKKHLKVAFDEIDRLKQENDELRMRSEVYNQWQRTDSDALPKSNETEKEGSDDELEATL